MSSPTLGQSRINLLDDADAIRRRSARPDRSGPLPETVDELKPRRGRQSGGHLRRLPGLQVEVLAEFAARLRTFKPAWPTGVARSPIGENMRRLIADPAEIDRCC